LLIYQLDFASGVNNYLETADHVTVLRYKVAYVVRIVLPKSLISVTFGDNMTWPIDLPKSVRWAKFGMWFNAPVDLPESLLYLEFGAAFNRPLILPAGLQTLTFGTHFDQPLNERMYLFLLHN